jgi:peptide/nickel transport system permease protein
MRELFFRLNIVAKIGLAVIFFLLIVAFFAPLIAPYSPYSHQLAKRLETPSYQHLLGLDEYGRDILSRLIYGAGISLYIGIFVVSISAILGISLGLIAGYEGGWVDEIIMRITDTLLAFPGILLAIALMAIVGASLNNVILALCLIGWVSYARLTRGLVLQVKEMSYILAAKAIGAGKIRILIRHILPNILSPVIIQATLGIAGVIISEASLSFLGLGVEEGVPSWGAMLNGGREYMLEAPHLTIFPGLAIMITVLGFNFMGDGLRDALDPKHKLKEIPPNY